MGQAQSHARHFGPQSSGAYQRTFRHDDDFHGGKYVNARGQVCTFRPRSVGTSGSFGKRFLLAKTAEVRLGLSVRSTDSARYGDLVF